MNASSAEVRAVSCVCIFSRLLDILLFLLTYRLCSCSVRTAISPAPHITPDTRDTIHDMITHSVPIAKEL